MRLPWRRGYIEAAAWLADDVLLAIGWSLAPAEAMSAYVRRGGRKSPIGLRAHGVSRPDVPDCPHPAGKVFVIEFSELLPRGVPGDLVIEGGGGRFVTSPNRLLKVSSDPALVASARLGWLSRQARDELIAFLVKALIDGRSQSSVQLAESLRDIRAILGDAGRHTGTKPFAHLDQIFRLDDRSFYLTGWTPDQGDTLRLTAVSPEGQRAELLPNAFRHRRTDFADRIGPAPGFSAFLHFDGPSLADDGWTVEHVGHDQSVHEHDGPSVSNDALAAEHAILEGIQFEDPARPRFIPNLAFPALERLQHRRPPAAIRDVLQCGVVPSAPDVSLVVPLFRRLDLIEHQFSHFIADPDVGRRVELVFVLDSPELAPEAAHTLTDLHSLYGIPCRAAVLMQHAGFSAACNAGVSLAQGPLVVLLNSDVFPIRPGWAADLATFYNATPRIGALGPKLLFEDDTLQHAGMYFERPPGCAMWMNKHYYKGFDRRLPAANVARRVPAVTGACLMIAKRLFLEHGGLRGCYVQGDYEDSDLCLRLQAAGHENWYLPEVELYHLEGQSYHWDPERAGRSLYNAWVHNHLWGDTIDGIMRASENRPDAAPAG